MLTVSSQPYVIQCADLAMQRACGVTRTRLKGGLGYLPCISASAALFGFFGVVLGILNSFRSMGTSWSAAFGDLTYRISEAMLPGLMGLFVALLAFWGYRFLSAQLETFEQEMKCTSLDVVNQLTVHLQRLRIAEPVAGFALSRSPRDAEVAANPVPFAAEGPRLTFPRTYRNGVLQLLWPKLESEYDAISILDLTSWICLVYGMTGWLAYSWDHRYLARFILLAFFAAAGFAIRKSSLAGVVRVGGFLILVSVACIVSYGFQVESCCTLLATLPFIGAFKAARSLAPARQMNRPMVWLRSLLLASLSLGAIGGFLLQTPFTLYSSLPDETSMLPTIVPGDRLIGVHGKLMGRIQRGDLVAVSWAGSGCVRVIGLPGDRVQIKRGQLVLNGALVRETYTIANPDPRDDFPKPVSSDARGDLPLNKELHDRSRIDNAVYIVPSHCYFVLNDNRKQADDSRTIGAVPADYVLARLGVRFSLKRGFGFISNVRSEFRLP